jgi:hypothetical protein
MCEVLENTFLSATIYVALEKMSLCVDYFWAVCSRAHPFRFYDTVHMQRDTMPTYLWGSFHTRH